MAKAKSLEGPRPTLRGKLLKDSPHLAAEEFNGKEYTLTIERVDWGDVQEEGTDSKKREPLVYFKETKKTLVLNAINGRRIAKLYGTAAEGWTGKRVTLYPTTCKAFGDPKCPCIRVKAEIPPEKGTTQAPAPQQSAPATEDDGKCYPGKPGCSDDITGGRCTNHPPS